MYRIQTSYQGEPYYLTRDDGTGYWWNVNVNQARLFSDRREAMRVAQDATEYLTLKGFAEFVVEVVKV